MQSMIPKTFDELVERAPEIVQEKLEQLKSLKERSDYHPESNTREHIKIVTERLMTTEDPDLVLAGLLHDLGKLETVRKNLKTGWPTSPGHDKWAAKFVREDRSVQNFIQEMGADVENVVAICAQHMRMKQLNIMRKHKQDALRNMKIFPKLEIFNRADNMLDEFNL